MKHAALTLAIFAIAQSLHASATAYQALEYLTERKGDDVLDQVFVIQGRGGDSQPKEWVLFRGRSNASTFQTMKIRDDGRISTGTASSREAELQPHALPVNFSVLNLDTNAAWNIAKRVARKESFRFTEIEYRLATHPVAMVPAWTLRLFNEKNKTMGEVVLSGATGEVLNPLRLYRYYVEGTDGQEQLVTRREPWSNRAMRSIGRWFSRTGEAYGHDLMRAAGTAEEILVDRRTRDLSEDAR